MLMAPSDTSDTTRQPSARNTDAATRRPIRAVMKRYRPSRKALQAAGTRDPVADNAATIHAPPGIAAPPTTARRLSVPWTLPGTPTVQVFELWLGVPRERQVQVERFVMQRTGVRSQHETLWLDTSAADLAHAGLGLALQRERGVWNQKLSSLESGQQHDVVLGAAAGVPRGDLTRHASHALVKRAMRAVGGTEAPLSVQSVCVEHIHARSTRHAGGHVELTFSRWRSRAANRGSCGGTLMLRGPDASRLVELARQLAPRFGLWMGEDQTAWRAGFVRDGGQAVLARALRLDAGMPPSAALAAMVENSLQQIVPNVAALAAGRGRAEHLHQARVGIRRLRAALRAFAEWAPDVDANWEPTLAEIFRRLGAQRDLDVLQCAVFPAIAAAGGPAVQFTPTGGIEAAPQRVARDPRITSLLLSLQAFVWNHRGDPPAAASTDAAATRERASADLRKMHIQLSRDAKRFARSDVERQHRARKRLKRLRYCAEFVASLFPRRKAQRFLDALRPAQEAIGQYTDLLVAEDHLLQEAVDDVGRWFALGWIAARRAPAITKAEKSLRRSMKVLPPW